MSTNKVVIGLVREKESSHYTKERGKLSHFGQKLCISLHDTHFPESAAYARSAERGIAIKPIHIAIDKAR